MNRAAQAYRPVAAAFAYGRGIRNVFIQRSYRNPRELASIRPFHDLCKNHLLHLRYQHHDLRLISTSRLSPQALEWLVFLKRNSRFAPTKEEMAAGYMRRYRKTNPPMTPTTAGAGTMRAVAGT